MTLNELALEYAQTAASLHRRITELEHARDAAQGELRVRLDQRTRPLRAMYRNARTVARYLEHYYDRSGPRPGTGADQGRRS